MNSTNDFCRLGLGLLTHPRQFLVLLLLLEAWEIFFGGDSDLFSVSGGSGCAHAGWPVTMQLKSMPTLYYHASRSGSHIRLSSGLQTPFGRYSSPSGTLTKLPRNAGWLSSPYSSRRRGSADDGDHSSSS